MSIDHVFFAWLVYAACPPFVFEMSSRPAPSAALVAANQRLHKMRAQIQAPSPTREQCPVNSEAFTAHCLPIVDLPEHLGWHSEAVSRVIRAKQASSPVQKSQSPLNFSKNPIDFPPIQSEAAQRTALSVDLSQSVTVFPDIALAMLRQEQSAAGRLWLLLRHLDVDGRGVLRVVNLRKTLTTTKTRHRLCGWRQLRNLLRQGDGLYWQRDKERVWLRSAGRVAAALGVAQLNGRPVAVPVKHLLGSVGEARAYLYASFHAGRQPADACRPRQKPIARDTLSALTGLTAECQRGYERRIGVHVSQNYVVGERVHDAGREERFWQRGGGAFEFVDFRGGQGRPGMDYMAWQLPNSYAVSLAHRPKGRQKRINRMLSDLFMQGMTGNTQRTIEKRYFGDGAGAAKAVRKRDRAEAEVFWMQGGGSGNGRLRMWYAVSPSHE